ncbi:phytanoyl-CoA dioxygenase family protein [Breoghania sp. L-A4]|uniref:phytanoyl-CoA dioxygenase family protein n=1 Tax=Breoghania sp. L-A4 TaxID=2304600 RepID=UPI000E35C3EF|nr:phytanoyl-CoA dioxygenase family protein [Breoghania sp. L-A4]AXS39897.1 phytanoyl-CoA dioxygenase [Breoghania sp. L-A4]
MTPLDVLKAPLWIAEIGGAAKSFAANPILGNPTLNRYGLHLARVKTAGWMADRRRAWLARALDEADRAAYARDGFLEKRDFLAPDAFAQLRSEIYGRAFPAREMRQGPTVTRMVPLPNALLKSMPATASVVRSREIRAAMHYMSSRGGEPTFFIQTVLADPSRKAADPQTDLHADTFHSTVKCWLFLHDVGEDDGPFAYVPGSHRLTRERLDWEYRQSLGARDARGHHSFGSFRMPESDLQALGLPAPRRMAVKANTLIIADTFGFHARSPSSRKTLRVEINGNIRRNPFLPWTGLDPVSLPGLKGNELTLYLKYLDWRQKHFKKGNVWRDVGEVMVDADAVV